MQTPLHTLDLVNTTNPDRRRTMRAERSAEASLSTAGRTPCDAMVTDVSHHGCCVETRADWLRPGRFVAIRLADGEPLQSIVRWSQDGFAGLELLRHIPDDRADWLSLID